MELFVVKSYPVVLGIEGVGHVVTSVCILAYMLDNAEKAIFAHRSILAGPFEYAQLKLRRNTGIRYCQGVVEVNVLLFLD